MSDDGLRDKAIRGAKWRVVTVYVSKAIQFVSAVVLPWLLLPSDYGLVAAVMAVILIIRSCGSLGMNYAMVQRRGRLEDAARTALTLLFAVAVVSYAAVLLLGPLKREYATHQFLFAVLGLYFFLRPVAIVAEGTLQREFRFGRLFIVEVSSVAVSAALAITLALVLPKGQGHWALAASGLAREGVRSIAAGLCSRVRLRPAFDGQLAKELLHYGKYFVGGAVVMTLYSQLERLALSELLSSRALGLYVFAYTWVFQVGDVSETVFGGVSLPVYAQLQEETSRLRSAFCRIVSYSALLSTGLLTGLIVLVPEAVALAFPPRWGGSVPIFQILGLYYVVRAVDTTTGQLYAAIGRPKYNMWLGVVNLAVMAATVWPFILWWGTVGAAWSVLVARCAQLVCNAAVCRRVLQCPLRTLARTVIPALMVSAVMAGVLLLGQMAAYRAWGQIGWIALTGLILLGAAAYAAALRLVHPTLFRDITDVLRDGLRGARTRIRDRLT